MFTNSFKSILIAGALTIGGAFAATAPAQAGSNFGVYIGGGYGSGIYLGNNGHRKQYKPRKRVRHHARCAPRRALNKAYRYGLDRPFIKRINNRKIVVRGLNRGYPARIVFSRQGRGCQIIRTNGI